MVQADSSRHGPDCALSRPAGSEGNAAVARPDPRSKSSANWRTGHCGTEIENPRLWTVRFPTGFDSVGVGVNVPRLRQARWRERRPRSPRTAKELGGKPTSGIGE